MNKLRLLKKMNDEELFECLTGEELRIFLIMIAGSLENGEGEIFPCQINWAFGKDFSPEMLKKIFTKLEEKRLVAITSNPGSGTSRNSFSITYRILLHRHSTLLDAKSKSE